MPFAIYYAVYNLINEFCMFANLTFLNFVQKLKVLNNNSCIQKTGVTRCYYPIPLFILDSLEKTWNLSASDEVRFKSIIIKIHNLNDLLSIAQDPTKIHLFKTKLMKKTKNLIPTKNRNSLTDKPFMDAFKKKRTFSTKLFGVNWLPGLQPKNLTHLLNKYKIIIYDFETVVHPKTQNLIPYLCTFYSSDLNVNKTFSFIPPDDVLFDEKTSLVYQKWSSDIIQFICTFENVIFIAHNAMRFDFLFLFSWFIRHIENKFKEDLTTDTMTLNKYMDLLARNNKYLAFTYKEKNLRFLDSYLYLPHSLDTLTKHFDLILQKDTLTKHITKFSIKDLQKEDNLADLIKYNQKDCLLLDLIMHKFIKIIITKFGLHPFEKTATVTGLGYRIFRTVSYELLNKGTQINNKKLLLMTPSLFATNMIRSAYRGGRCEIFNHYASVNNELNNTEVIDAIDANSLYPSVMYGFPMPLGLALRTPVNKLVPPYTTGVYYCEINCKEDTVIIPFLHFTTEDAQSIYPVGSWFGCYTNVELNYALTLGCYEIKVLDAYVFEGCGYIFDNFIKPLSQWKYEATQNKDTVGRYLAKTLMNSVSGKFGQKEFNNQSLFVNDLFLEHEIVNKSVATAQGDIHPLYGKYMATKVGNFINVLTFDNSNMPRGDVKAKGELAPQISCFITAYGRIVMHKAMMDLQVNNATLLYTDTDSVCFKHNNNFNLDQFNQKFRTYFDRDLITDLGTFSKVYPNKDIKLFFSCASKLYKVSFKDQPKSR